MSRTKESDPVADVFAGLDARAADLVKSEPSPGAKLLAAAQAKQEAKEAAQADAPAAKRKARALARLALAGATSGAQRHELHRPKYGEQRSLELPTTSQGRLASPLEQLVAGRSRRYSQDLEGWCRASLADHRQRGVLVTWDGMFYTITLDPDVPHRTVTEVHRRDLAAWRASL